MLGPATLQAFENTCCFSNPPGYFLSGLALDAEMPAQVNSLLYNFYPCELIVGVWTNHWWILHRLRLDAKAG